MENIYIYTLSDPITGEVRYIGKTKNIRERYLNHLGNNNLKSHKSNWIKSLKKRDLKPVIEILDIVTNENWKFWESYWISQFLTWGYNLTNHTHGGEGSTFGNVGSFKKDYIPWNKNIKGYKTNKKGYTMPEEVKLKISNTLKGKESKKKRPVRQFDKNYNFIKEFPSILEAKKETGIKGISNVLCNKAKTAGGYLWQ